MAGNGFAWRVDGIVNTPGNASPAGPAFSAWKEGGSVSRYTKSLAILIFPGQFALGLMMLIVKRVQKQISLF